MPKMNCSKLLVWHMSREFPTPFSNVIQMSEPWLPVLDTRPENRGEATNVLKQSEINRVMISTYHLGSNGTVESAMRTLKDALLSFSAPLYVSFDINAQVPMLIGLGIRD